MNKLFIRIKPNLIILEEGNQIVFTGSYGEFVTVLNNSLTQKLIELLINGSQEKKIIIALANLFNCEEEPITNLLHELKQKGVLENYLPNEVVSNEMYNKYQTQLSFFDLLNPASTVTEKIALQKKIQSLNVMVIGCGGIGTCILQSLVLMGIGKIVIVDGDIVEASNLNRQVLFDEQDKGKPKAFVAAERLKKSNSQCKIIAINEMIKNEADVKTTIEISGSLDFIFICGDTPQLPLWVDSVCKEVKLPYIKASYQGTVGFIGPLIVPNGKRFAEVLNIDYMQADDNEIVAAHNSKHKHASFIAANSIIANMAVMEATKYLLQLPGIQTIGKRMFYNFQNMYAFFEEDFL